MSCKYEKAFSLIELLVVIAIIAILAALLMTALSSAKNRAAEMVDVNNLKQVVEAVQMYANDNHDVLPWANWGSAAYPGWLYKFQPTETGQAQYDVTEGLLWSTLKSQRLYLCPLENTNSALFSQREEQLSSYVMNGAVVGYYDANYPAVRLSRMQPTDVAFWEADENDPWYFNDGANIPDEGITARHSGGGVEAMFGGSVSHIRMGAWYVEDYNTNKNSLWCNPDSPDGRY
jgi:prepilin-type N-terminal cleavage/methylation domain-containing protein